MSEKRQKEHAPCSLTPRSIAQILEIEFITVNEAADLHFYSRRTIRMWCDEGRFECYKWSGHWMIVRSDIDKYCRERRDADRPPVLILS